MARFPLQLVLELTQKRYEEAERELQKANAKVEEELQRQQMVEQYRGEYQQRLLAAQQGGLSVAQWRDFQRFIAKLDIALQDQQDAVARAREFAASRRALWEEARIKLKAFEVLEAKHRESEARREARQEQKQSDEFAQKQQHKPESG